MGVASEYTNSGQSFSGSGTVLPDVNDQLQKFKVENKSSQNSTLPTLLEAFQTAILQQQAELSRHKVKLEEISKVIDKQNNEVKKTQLKSVEVVGVISSVIAIGISFVASSNQQKDVFTSAVILILTTCAFTVFATLIHFYFAGETINKNAKMIIKYSIVTSSVVFTLSIIGQQKIAKFFDHFRLPTYIPGITIKFDHLISLPQKPAI